MTLYGPFDPFRTVLPKPQPVRPKGEIHVLEIPPKDQQPDTAYEIRYNDFGIERTPVKRGE